MASPSDRVHVLIPVKGLDRAKSRLGEHLSGARRRALVLAMFADTLTAALAADTTAAITVITADPHVSALARKAGAGVLAEPSAPGSADLLNAALTAAAAPVTARGRAVLALHADLPALTATDLAAAVRRAAAADRGFVPDRSGAGTTALYAGPGIMLDPRFGPGSATAHRRSGAVAVPGAAGLRCDVDTVDDLKTAAAIGLGAHTAAVVAADDDGSAPGSATTGAVTGHGGR